jgi:hypothetical protein
VEPKGNILFSGLKKTPSKDVVYCSSSVLFGSKTSREKPL